MYFISVALLMFVLPILSILVDGFIFDTSAGGAFLLGKWFVFWAIGIRLVVAGLRQALNPGFTAEQIFGIKSAEPLVIVQELGFANLALGILGISTILNSSWIMPAAIVGCLFYGLAGLRHLLATNRNNAENGAMISDLFIFLVLLVYFALSFGH